LPKSHSRNRYVRVDSLPVVPSSQAMARACALAPSSSGGSSATSAVTHVLRLTPACGGQPPSGRPVARIHCRRAWPAPSGPRRATRGRRRPWVQSTTSRGHRASRHPDSVCPRDLNRHRAYLAGGRPAWNESPASRSSWTLPEHSPAAAARQQHDERDTRPQPDRSLNHHVHTVLLLFVIAQQGGRAHGDRPQIPYCCCDRRVLRCLKKPYKRPRDPRNIKSELPL